MEQLLVDDKADYPLIGGFELLDVYRTSKAQLLSNDTVFVEAFKVRTAHILRGLDWTNVCVTGEILLVGLPAPFRV